MLTKFGTCKKYCEENIQCSASLDRWSRQEITNEPWPEHSESVLCRTRYSTRTFLGEKDQNSPEFVYATPNVKDPGHVRRSAAEHVIFSKSARKLVPNKGEFRRSPYARTVFEKEIEGALDDILDNNRRPLWVHIARFVGQSLSGFRERWS